MEQKEVPWELERCNYSVDSGQCKGIRLGNDGNCFAHTTSDERALALAMFHTGADLNFTRGVPLTEELLARILHHAPAKEGRSVLRNADFSMATFTAEYAWFGDVTFSGEAQFDGATFSGEALFDGATFTEYAWFREATFSAGSSFSDATFANRCNFTGATFGSTGRAVFDATTFTLDAWFSDATFSGEAQFHEATFSRHAWFREAIFSRDVWFSNTTFSRDVFFDEASFSGDAKFHAATFSKTAWFTFTSFSGNAQFDEVTFVGDSLFDGATFDRNAVFSNATFERSREFGPIVVIGTLDLDNSTFFEKVDAIVSANHVTYRGSSFRRGANFRVRWGLITFEDADLSEPFLLSWLRLPVHPLEIIIPGLVFAPSEDLADSMPRIQSLRRANVGGLAVSAVDLSGCRFAGAHNLDQLRIEGEQQFASRPKGWRRQLGWPPVWKWTVRRVLAEEHEWRYEREGGIRQKDWYPDECQPPPPEEIDPQPASDIQSIYRDLRKGREDDKDEPGAADFYYGEMEMRRAASPPSIEKIVLWLYWLVSGYGLRASRALLALALTVLLCAFALKVWGMPKGDERDFAEMVVFGMQSTTSFLRAPDVTLTLPGQVIQIALRLLGPLFFGLALLSLRGRVRR